MSEKKKPFVEYTGELYDAVDGLIGALGRHATITPEDLFSVLQELRDTLAVTEEALAAVEARIQMPEPEILLDSDEAYEIIRRFCYNRLNQFFTPDELRVHLEMNAVDLSDVDDDELLDKLDSLAAVIAKDLERIHGIRVLRMEDKTRTAFCEIGGSNRPVVKVPSIVSIYEDSQEEVVPPIELSDEQLLERFAAMVSEKLHEDMRRRDVCALMAEELGVRNDLVDASIARIIERKLIPCYRKDGVSWLTLDAERAASIKESSQAAYSERKTERKRVEKESIDLGLATSILEVFIAPGRLASNAFTIRDLWREMNGGEDADESLFTADDVASIRIAARKLALLKLVWCGQGSQQDPKKPTKNGTFRIGVSSQDVKDRLQAAKAQEGGIEQMLKDITSGLDTID